MKFKTLNELEDNGGVSIEMANELGYSDEFVNSLKRVYSVKLKQEGIKNIKKFEKNKYN